MAILCYVYFTTIEQNRHKEKVEAGTKESNILLGSP